MNFIVFDTEDNSKELLAAGKSGFDKQVTQIAARTGDGSRRHYQAVKPDTARHCWSGAAKFQFLAWLESRPEKYIYAHNLQYDLGNLFADQLDFLDVVMVGGRMIRARWHNKVFVDSFNIWPMSAAKLGAAFGLEKLETKSMATDKDYVFRDVEIIRLAMRFVWTIVNRMGITDVPPTLGSLAVKIWRHWLGENPHDSSKLAMAAFYGGRVELFKVKSESNRVCWTDINSLYPFVMTRPFPGVLEDYGGKLAPWGVAEVTIKVPQSALTVLPFRQADGRILYPYGELRGAWTCLEIKEAIRQGAQLLKVHQCLGTVETVRPYANFMERLYGARLEAKTDAEKLFFKLLMNTLFGRLGTRGEITRSVWQTPKNRDDGVPYGDKVLATYKMKLPDEVNWCHAAYITAYGRLELFKYMRIIGAESLIYCDTDSTIFDAPTGKIPFAVGTDLGQMKLEGWNKAAQCWAPKMYRVGKKWKAKGVPVRLAKEFITRGKVEFEMPFKFREAVRFYDPIDLNGHPRPANQRKLSVWRKVEKTIQGTYDRKTLVGNRFFPCKVADSLQSFKGNAV